MKNQQNIPEYSRLFLYFLCWVALLFLVSLFQLLEYHRCEKSFILKKKKNIQNFYKNINPPLQALVISSIPISFDTLRIVYELICMVKWKKTNNFEQVGSNSNFWEKHAKGRRLYFLNFSISAMERNPQLELGRHEYYIIYYWYASPFLKASLRTCAVYT